MKAIKYVNNSSVFESLIITNPIEGVNPMMDYLLNGGYSWSFNQGLHEWTIDLLDLTELSVDQAQEFKNLLLELEELAGIDEPVQKYFNSAICDCNAIIAGIKPLTHRKEGVIISLYNF